MCAGKGDGRRTSWLDRRARRIVLDMFRGITKGCLVVREGDKEIVCGDLRCELAQQAVITVHDPSAYSALLNRGSIGAGESYMQGLWSTDDLYQTIHIVISNPPLYEAMDGLWTRFSQPFRDAAHWLRRNNHRGSRRNIHAHYDLGNDLFSLFLDDTMAYSCGIFERENSTLQEASEAKFDRICRKLRIGPDDHVLEIGTGWGGFCLHAAKHYGCRVTTTTISNEQRAFAAQRVAAAGLQERVCVLDRDYRELSGQYDKLVSIEMIEAVGHRYLDRFFECCAGLLKPHGLMALQAITLRDDLYRRHRGTATFVNTHIFPGSFIPSTAAMCRSLARKTCLRLVHLEDITPHYSRTLRAWRERFMANLSRVRDLGLTDELIRMWEFYFCYCEAGFAERQNAVDQMIFAMPESRHQPVMPPALGADDGGRMHA